MSFYQKISHATRNLYNENFIKEVDFLLKEIQRNNSFDGLNKLEIECLKIIDAANRFKQTELLAIGLYVLGYFYKSKIKLQRVM